MTMRTWAISDIHGFALPFQQLLEVIEFSTEDRLILLGDYVDRGPDSALVLQSILHLRKNYHVITLRGNHEILMADAFHGHDEFRMWYSVGGKETLFSYTAGLTTPQSLSQIPQEHYRLITSELIDLFETETEIFVHANLEESTPLAEQSELYLFWEFLTGPIKHLSGKRVICGHTYQKEGFPAAWPSTVCIDTGVYATGWLTAFHVEANEFVQTHVSGKVRQGKLTLQ